jgi:hypothetical protein
MFSMSNKKTLKPIMPKTWNLQGNQNAKKSWIHDQKEKVHWNHSWKHNNTKRKKRKDEKKLVFPWSTTLVSFHTNVVPFFSKPPPFD